MAEPEGTRPDRSGESEPTSEERLRTLLRILPVGVIITDADGAPLYGNAEARRVWGGEVLGPVSVDEYEKFVARWADTGERVQPHDMDERACARGRGRCRAGRVGDRDV